MSDHPIEYRDPQRDLGVPLVKYRNRFNQSLEIPVQWHLPE